MILGIGSDLADIRRIARTLERFGERFARRVFTEEERSRSERLRRPEDAYARRWAAKEACSKALGTGIGDGVAWQEMEVINLPSGQPLLRLTGGARQRLLRLTPPGMEPRVHVTLTDDPPYAQAFVVLEAVSPGTPVAPGAGAPA
ncbi:MAG: holo-ACP synthase [Pseudomonadota bacterium]